MNRWLGKCAGAFLILVAACGDSAGTGGAGAGGASGGSAGDGGDATGGNGPGICGADDTPVECFCNELVGPLCDAVFSCCTDGQKLADMGGTIDGCKTQLATECLQNLAESVGPALAAGLTELNEARLAFCTANLEQAANTCDRSPLAETFSCFGSFQGTVAPGETCGVVSGDVSFVECDNGTCENDVCIGFLDSGDPCNPSQSADQFCNLIEGEWCSGVTSLCAPRGEIGDPCDPVFGTEMQCISRNCDAVTSTCLPPSAEQLCEGQG